MNSRRIVMSAVAVALLSTPIHGQSHRGGDSQPRWRGCYGLLKLDAHVTPEERAELAQEGVEILSHHEGTTYRVRLPRCTTQVAESQGTFVRLSDRDRVAPKLWAGEFDAFAVMLPDSTIVNPALNPDSTLRLTVSFFRTASDGEMNAALASVDAAAAERQADYRWVVSLARDSLRSLAKLEIVEWIDAGPRPFVPEVEVTRRVLEIDAVQRFDPLRGRAEGLSGRRVTVGLFDSGIDEAHPDFADRVRNAAGHMLSWHGTHVAGILAGGGNHSDGIDGWGMSTGGTKFQYRGLAPDAELLEGTKADTDRTFAYKHYLQSGMLLSNHSYSLGPDGVYDTENRTRDRQIRGEDEDEVRTGHISARLQVYSAGNSGESPSFGSNQVGYFSLTKQLKNGLLVGNYVPDSLRISRSSSLGPTHDGRIKPDLVAPGSDVLSTGFCNYYDYNDAWRKQCKSTTGATVHRNYYRRATGTSMATPAVTGMLALVLEEYARTYGVDLSRDAPLPSTLRAVAIHTATDLVSEGAWFRNEDGPVIAFRGPDFATGWGLANAKEAVELVQRREILQSVVNSTCDSLPEFFVDVPRGGPLRVTLAWDDPAGKLGQDPRLSLLKHDLDLVLVSPSGRLHRPWLLDQDAHFRGVRVADDAQQCGTTLDIHRQLMPRLDPAFNGINHTLNRNDRVPDRAVQPARRGRDHLNNVEQVVVDDPEPGRWRVRVIGFNLPEGPQQFSLVGATFVRR